MKTKKWAKLFAKKRKEAEKEIRKIALRERIDKDIDGFEFGYAASRYR